jgi:hypothetical protein
MRSPKRKTRDARRSSELNVSPKRASGGASGSN